MTVNDAIHNHRRMIECHPLDDWRRNRITGETLDGDFYDADVLMPAREYGEITSGEVLSVEPNTDEARDAAYNDLDNMEPITKEDFEDGE